MFDQIRKVKPVNCQGTMTKLIIYDGEDETCNRKISREHTIL